ncbi:Trk K+ transport system, NAD-binding component [Streptomyces sp. ScaeMP-e48]|uniref:CASTOR/POLLUX-related putative ion channel n=1 Tax=Streptomyces sp. ScaeMP-e48 TaxID=1100823 RepID=UPI00082398DF|nr:NAD-binding lipoprotein [Streptomyces sp. ScaeMP-e48]SCK15963.1 Trk K+ transport system, NAD-binding component [Streptomyces sp. ScaeMP-e48]
MGTADGRPRVSLREWAGYRFDRTLARSTGTLMGWLVITCLAIVVPVSTLLVWTDPGSPRSLSGRLTAAWRTSAETLRLGAASGTPLRLVLSALLGLVALLCVSTLVGVITTGLAERLAELSRGRSTVLEQGHVLVLGWSDQVTTVVGELVAAQAPRRPRVIVVLADRDKAEMEQVLTARVGPAVRTRIICRSGPASDPDVLALVSPRAASTVLVLPSTEPTADAEVLRVLLALRAVLGEGADGPPVLAAVRDDRYRAPARLAAGPRGTVLETDLVTARLIAQCVGRPGLSLVLRDLLDFAGDEFHLADATAFQDGPFGATLLGHPNSCVVGLLTPDGRTLLNPPADTVVGPGSRLIVLAHDDDSTRVGDCGHLVDDSVIVAAPSERDGPTRLLLLGWNRRAPLVVRQLRRTARPGSFVDVLTDSVVPGPREPEYGKPESGTPEHGTPNDGTPDHGPPAGPDVRFRSAALSRPETLLGLDLGPYDGLVVLGPDGGAGPDHPDDWTLVALLALRLLEERTGREVRVVTELIDDRNRPLAPVNTASDVIVSGMLTGLLMAQIAQNRHLAPLFDELFSAEGSDVCLRPAGTYVRPGAEATFATVVAAARDRGECAIGYRRHDGRTGRADQGIRLNPSKSERHVWNAEDHVVVVARDRDLPTAPSEPADATDEADATTTAAVRPRHGQPAD